MVSGSCRRGPKESSKSTGVEPPLPEGWTLANSVNRNGEIIKCYKNVIGQKFHTMEDLMRYVEYAQREQISIYTPGFDPSQLQLANRSSEDVNLGFSEEEKRNALKKVSVTDPPGASKPNKQAGDRSRKKKPKSTLKVSTQSASTSKKLDGGSTSSDKGKEAIATSSLSRASESLAGRDLEIVPYSNPEKALELKTKDDIVTSDDHH